jgi:hypothetical protein
MSNWLSFQEIYEGTMIAIGDAQYTRAVEVKAVNNMVYLNEICQCDDLYPLFWLLDQDTASKKSKVRAKITGITAATPPVVSSASHGFVDGDVITIYGVVGMTDVNGQTYVVKKDSANAYHLHDFTGVDVVGAGFAAWSSGGYAYHRGVTLSDCQSVYKANWHGYDNGMTPIGPDEIEERAAWMSENPSRPTRCMHRKVFTAAGAQEDYLLWYPVADAEYNLRVWVDKYVARLSGTGDVPLGPVQVGDAIIAGSIMRLGVNAVQVEAGVVWPSVYKSNLDAIRSLNRKWWEKLKPSERSGHFLI